MGIRSLLVCSIIASVAILGVVSFPTGVRAESGLWTVEYFNLEQDSYLAQPPEFDKDYVGEADVQEMVDSIDFDLGSGSPAPGVNPDRYVARFTKTVNAAKTADYSFSTRSDDGIRVFVDDELVIDEWNDHSATYHSGQTYVAEGAHTITVLYYENGYDSVVVLDDIRLVDNPHEPVPVIESSVESNQHIGADFVFSASVYQTDGTNPCTIDIEGVVLGCPNHVVYQFGGLSMDLTVTNQAGIEVIGYDAAVVNPNNEPFDPDSTSPYSPKMLKVPFEQLEDGVYEVAIALRHDNGNVEELVVSGLQKGDPTQAKDWKAEFWNLPNPYQYLTSTPDFPASSPALTTTVEHIKFDWGMESPYPEVQPDRYLARFSKQIVLPEDGEYTMTTNSDDGVRVYLDGVAWINEWQDQSASVATATGFASAGQHNIVVEYYENGYDASLSFEMVWAGGQSYEDALTACSRFGEGALVHMVQQRLSPGQNFLPEQDTGFDLGGYSSVNVGPYRVYGVSYDDHSQPGSDGASESWTISTRHQTGEQAGLDGWLYTTDLDSSSNVNTSLLHPYIYRSQTVDYQQASVVIEVISNIDNSADSVTPVCVAFVPYDGPTPSLSAELVFNGYENPDDTFFFGSKPAYKQPRHRVFRLSPIDSSVTVGLPVYNLGPGGTSIITKGYLGNTIEEIERSYPHVAQSSGFDLEDYELVSVGGQNCDDGYFELAFETNHAPMQNAHCVVTVNYLGDNQQQYSEDFEGVEASDWSTTRWGGAEVDVLVEPAGDGDNRLIVSASNNDSEFSGVRLQGPDMTVDDSSQYQIFFEYSSTQVGEYLLAEKNGSGNVLSYTWLGGLRQNNWTSSVDAIYTPVAGATHSQLLLDLRSGNGELRVDNITLTKQ